jgi:hypothetical protein
MGSSSILLKIGFRRVRKHALTPELCSYAVIATVTYQDESRVRRA